MAPYFMQNKVVAVNIKDITVPGKTAEELQKMTNAEFDGLFTGEKTYANIFKQLKDYGVRAFTINDYMRDNMMIGSENADGSEFTSEVKDLADGKKQVDSFMSKVKAQG